MADNILLNITYYVYFSIVINSILSFLQIYISENNKIYKNFLGKGWLFRIKARVSFGKKRIKITGVNGYTVLIFFLNKSAYKFRKKANQNNGR